MANLTTEWIWQEGNATRALNLNVEKRVLLWHDDLPGFCAYAPREQTIEDFVANGASRFAEPPADVLEEVRASVAQVQNR